jgi:predicted acylesterase/phospholipase RssA
MIEHLILSGAATNGLIQIGLLTHLLENEIIHMKNIKSIYATSAGAIISILLLIGVSVTEIKEYFNFH